MSENIPKFINKDDLADLVDLQEEFLREAFPEREIYRFVMIMMSMLNSFSRKSSKSTIESIVGDNQVNETILNLAELLQQLMNKKMSDLADIS
jgi:hypothetical protein